MEELDLSDPERRRSLTEVLNLQIQGRPSEAKLEQDNSGLIILGIGHFDNYTRYLLI